MLWGVDPKAELPRVMSLFLLRELTKASPDSFYDFVLVIPDKKTAIVNILFASIAEPKVSH